MGGGREKSPFNQLAGGAESVCCGVGEGGSSTALSHLQGRAGWTSAHVHNGELLAGFHANLFVYELVQRPCTSPGRCGEVLTEGLKRLSEEETKGRGRLYYPGRGLGEVGGGCSSSLES